MILIGDALEKLKEIESDSVQCCVTSPPYFGLRNYGVEGQIGLEQTPEEFVEKLVTVFREVRRVLRKDATLFLNLGDSYAGGGRGGHADGKVNKAVKYPRLKKPSEIGLKPKDLIGIPWMTAFALRSDGWWLRQEIVWQKNNPMPESVTDRCTKSHEQIFLLTKSSKYYFNSDAIAEPITDSSAIRLLQNVEAQKGSDRVPGKTNGSMKAVGKKPELSDAKYEDEITCGAFGFKQTKKWDASMVGGGTSYVGHSGYTKSDGTSLLKPTRNKRSVWTINTHGYKGAHFATFPEKLPETCILAGSKQGDVILDPFFGAGTCGVVAKKLRRKWIGIELNPVYAKMAEERIKDTPEPML